MRVTRLWLWTWLWIGTMATCASAAGPGGAIAFSSLAPRHWDLYLTDLSTGESRRLTDHPALDDSATFSPDGRHLAFVSERDGNRELYLLSLKTGTLKRLTDDFAMDDHPTWSPHGDGLVFVSTREASKTPGLAWTRLYRLDASGNAKRIAPEESADYSPTWSPKGDLIAFASGSGKTHGTDVFVMSQDGSARRRVARDGGWPTFSADGTTIYFHGKRGAHWGVFQVPTAGGAPEQLTPAHLDVVTPAHALSGKCLAVAVMRKGHRQIELFDPDTRRFKAVTSDKMDHWSPALSSDCRFLVYHRAAPARTGEIDRWGTPPATSLDMLRVDGAFPSFARDGSRLALTSAEDFSSVDVMKRDGSGRRVVHRGKLHSIFGISWAPRGDVIAFSEGLVFQDARGKVDVASVRPDGTGYRVLTTGGNNGFPSYSPDGKQVVFRSGRDGNKNLYVMRADGSEIRRLTKGAWTDTMANWAPTGDRIAFASNRGGDFSIWIVSPDGTGLRQLVGGGGRNNHPAFSPDGEWVVFTSARAGYSVEEISVPFQYQPYGELFAIRADGSRLTRLTHNGFEEGTPNWGR